MNISYELNWTNKEGKEMRMTASILEDVKSLFKTLRLDNEIKNIKFYIVNNQKTEMKYDELI